MPTNIPINVHNNINIRRPTTIITTIYTVNVDPIYDYSQTLQESFDDQEELVRDRNNIINVEENIINDLNDKLLTEQCTICHSKFLNNDVIVKLSCNHTFHASCIKEWGHYNPACPLCKTEIPIKY